MREKIEDRRPINWTMKKRLLEETNGRCAHCGTHLERGENLTLEHFIPLSKGGSNDPENLTILCKKCNRFKSDMILPVSWYPYLSADKKNTFKELIDRYLKEVDYLTEDCVMMVDAFLIRTFIPIQKKLRGNGSQTMSMPVNVDVLRMTRYDAFKWLMEYKTSLQWQDACCTISHPKEWPAACYILKKGGIDLAMVCPHFVREWNKEKKCYMNGISFDWYFSPGLPDKDYMPKLLADLVCSVKRHVLETLSKTTKDAAAIIIFLMCFASDRFCNPVFDLIENPSGVIEFPTEQGATAHIRQAVSIDCIGGKKDGRDEIMNEMRKIEDEGMDVFDLIYAAARHQEALNGRIEEK